jgi:DNA-binding transcriptional regulator YdaS (Cro superfamily)
MAGGRAMETSLSTKKTMRITIETERHFVIRRATSARVWCEPCAAEVDMVPLESAAEAAQVDMKTIQHLLDHEKLHLSQPSGRVQVCLNSLLKSISKRFLDRGSDKSSGIPAAGH